MVSDKERDLFERFFTVPDYSSDVQLKKYVNGVFKESAELYDQIRNSSKEYCLRGPAANKRKTAILNNMDRARKEFGKLPLRSVEESFTEFESISFETYKYVDAVGSVTAGAAIWILDQLRMNGKLFDAFDYMPTDSMQIYDADIPIGIFHPAYEFELVLSVVHMIITRNGGRGLTDGGKRDENFDKLLALIDQEKLDHACKVFEEKQWDIIRRAMELAAFFDEEERKILRKLKSGSQPSPLMVVKEPALDKDDAMELADRGDEIHRNRRWIQQELTDHFYMSRKELVKSTGNRYAADILQGFEVDDPYELCMALILLLDNGSDAPWLMKSGTTLMMYAARMLPWFPFFDEEDFDEGFEEDHEEEYIEDLETLEENRFNRNDWINQPAEPELIDAYHTRFGKKNLAQIVFGLSNGVLPFRMHPFAKDRRDLIEKGMDEHVADKIESLSEIFFFDDYQTGAVNLRRKLLDSLAVDEVETADEEVETASASEKPEVDTAAELEKARREIKSLRRALSEVSRDANQQRAKYEQELKTLRQEHRELTDLREIVFNRERGEIEEKTESKIVFPYEPKKRTVIFGGHDVFLKTLRKLIPDAKYIDVDNYTFSPEIIRNADVVWVQNNYISHSQYGRVLDITRQYGIQLRYFTFASAEKSAEQLAVEDQK
ncbi:MAG: hypothetical protein E7220_04485 [Clostridiales bacterium]|nr:hypothetical protein [Clostridiales bacterium]